jgi:hypothetical protein
MSTPTLAYCVMYTNVVRGVAGDEDAEFFQKMLWQFASLGTASDILDDPREPGARRFNEADTDSSGVPIDRSWRGPYQARVRASASAPYPSYGTRHARRTHGERYLQLLGSAHVHVHLRRGRERHRRLQLRQGISDKAVYWRGLAGRQQGHELCHHLAPQSFDLTDGDKIAPFDLSERLAPHCREASLHRQHQTNPRHEKGGEDCPITQ